MLRSAKPTRYDRLEIIDFLTPCSAGVRVKRTTASACVTLLTVLLGGSRKPLCDVSHHPLFESSLVSSRKLKSPVAEILLFLTLARSACGTGRSPDSFHIMNRSVGTRTNRNLRDEYVAVPTRRIQVL